MENTHESIEALFQKPNKTKTGYDKVPLGKNTLGVMMKAIRVDS